MENIAVNLDNLSQEDKELLLKLVDKANKPKSKVWTPDHREEFWYLTSEGFIMKTKYGDTDFDKYMLEIGNCFQSHEDARFALERLLVLRKLRELANGFKPDCHRTAEFYVLTYNLSSKEVTIYYQQTYMRFNDVCFKTREDAKNAIEKIGAERLKKYYFCIEKEED